MVRPGERTPFDHGRDGGCARCTPCRRGSAPCRTRVGGKHAQGSSRPRVGDPPRRGRPRPSPPGTRRGGGPPLLDHDEVGLAVDELVGVLVAERVALTVNEIRQVGDVLTAMRDGGGSSRAAGRDVDAVVAVLDRVGRPLIRRGLPLQRAGTSPGPPRAGATQFPPGWHEQRVHDAIHRVAGAPTTLATAGRGRKAPSTASGPGCCGTGPAPSAPLLPCPARTSAGRPRRRAR